MGRGEGRMGVWGRRRLKMVGVEEGMRRKGEGKEWRGWKEGEEWDQ